MVFAFLTICADMRRPTGQKGWWFGFGLGGLWDGLGCLYGVGDNVDWGFCFMVSWISWWVVYRWDGWCLDMDS